MNFWMGALLSVCLTMCCPIGSADSGKVHADEVALEVAVTVRVIASGEVLDATVSNMNADDVTWMIDGVPVGIADPVASAPGCHTLVATHSDGRQGRSDFVVASRSTPSLFVDGLPKQGALLARDPKETAAELSVQITPAAAVSGYARIRLAGSEGTTDTDETRLCSNDTPVALVMSVPARLETFDVFVEFEGAHGWQVQATVTDIVAGDTLVIQGQSNAVAGLNPTDPARAKANVDQSTFIRSFGTQSPDPTASQNDRAWHKADGDLSSRSGSVGQWGLRLARRLVDEHEIPIAVFNGGLSGQRIQNFERNNEKPADTSTIYGRLLSRLRTAGLDGAVRAIIFYQGEADGFQWEDHRDGVRTLIRQWHTDHAALERVYITQVRGDGCGNPPVNLLETQRALVDEFPDVSMMTTAGLDGYDGCHFFYQGGYKVLGEAYADLLSRDLYATAAFAGIEPPSPAKITRRGTNELVVHMRGNQGTLTVDPSLAGHIELTGDGSVSAVRAQGSTLVITLLGNNENVLAVAYRPTTPRIRAWVRNVRGLGMLSFRQPVEN